MPQVSVTIAGKTYRMACAEGEEGHLEGLAAAYDTRIEQMRTSFGEIGDLRLHVMAAIAQADELHETKRRIAALESEVAMLNSVNASRDERLERIEARLAEGVQMAAERIEELARSLNSAGQG
ncbi:MAG: cell division protein ZapA [Microvirga sp.]|jgi:cell division protein ZapA|uniref:Cell division protein ZapA n=1 Tax=Microvirga tunisiensis TaxID=2108360 RepID=A0A5N7MG59_9HYPH|nr:cell division protein ZapA [Microvirga tunisiensis]MPR07848.1 cell division protein ZapA [Microvirga tunisiensis]MPR25813.1 cell division protein ZapA [Microvirga tunisiensis]